MNLTEAFSDEAVMDLAGRMDPEETSNLQDIVLAELHAAEIPGLPDSIEANQAVGQLMMRCFFAGFNWAEPSPESHDVYSPDPYFIDDEGRFHITLVPQQALAVIASLMGAGE